MRMRVCTYAPRARSHDHVDEKDGGYHTLLLGGVQILGLIYSFRFANSTSGYLLSTSVPRQVYSARPDEARLIVPSSLILVGSVQDVGLYKQIYRVGEEPLLERRDGTDARGPTKLRQDHLRQRHSCKSGVPNNARPYAPSSISTHTRASV